MNELNNMDASLPSGGISKLEQLRAFITALGRDGGASVDSDNPSATRLKTVSVPTQEGHDLRRWVTEEKAKHSIEIGLAYGYSALHICEALLQGDEPDVRHVVIDPWQSAETGFSGGGLENLKNAGVYDMIECYEEESQLALPRLLKEGRKFDFAFIDGNHRPGFVASH
jgi:predicted O-methyltransferase YrrM